MFAMRSDAQLDWVQAMVACGLSDYEVARRSGLPRSTVQRWRLKPGRQRLDPTWRPERTDEYAHALGLYLGDGHVVRKSRTGVLVISFDPRYPCVIERARQCLAAVFEPAVVHRFASGRIATYEYPRYFFTNLSADIRQIFCDHCDLLAIRWARSNPRNISVPHRDSVALLDGFVGPKS